MHLPFTTVCHPNGNSGNSGGLASSPSPLYISLSSDSVHFGIATLTNRNVTQNGMRPGHCGDIRAKREPFAQFGGHFPFPFPERMAECASRQSGHEASHFVCRMHLPFIVMRNTSRRQFPRNRQRIGRPFPKRKNRHGSRPNPASFRKKSSIHQ